MIVDIGSCREATLLRAASVIGVSSAGDAVEISPGIEGVGFAPAMRGAGGVRGGGQRGTEAVELIVGKRLGARLVNGIGDRIDVASVLAAERVHRIVADVDGASARGGGFEIDHLTV